MKYLFFIIIPLFLQACNTNESDHSIISPLSAIKIDSVQINGKHVTITVTCMIGTPCWCYYKSESSNDGNVFTSKIFGKYDGEICIEVVSSLKHIEQVNFFTSGTKELRFWQNDSTYLDTAIIL
ncbi:MAG TPA: hypothetical protein VMT35_18185 [Ignavibacteriaceae bacterium]|nr:hypothetical protein [Ignavibacteriaceae bacterium]